LLTGEFPRLQMVDSSPQMIRIARTRKRGSVTIAGRRNGSKKIP